MKRFALGMVVVLGSMLVGTQSASAQEPGWWGVVVARGQDRARIQATDIRMRPYRPLHFYGNTIRRNYYRGNPLPLPRDVVRGGFALFRRRTL